MQALKHCTDELACQTEVHSHGERFLEFLDRFLSFPDKTAAPEWRRVFVILNSSVVVVLSVRDLKDVPK